MVKRKIGLFFGAGAEISYGLPSGGRFALDIFKMDNSNDKATFKKMLAEIDKRSIYASKWLPSDYLKRTVTTFGKTQHEQIIISSLENKRSQIINYLNNFDAHSKKIIDEFKKNNIDVDKCFEDLNGSKVGSFLFTHEVKINNILGDCVKLFDSKYFSAILQILEKSKGNSDSRIEDLKNLVKSFIELLIGAMGEDFLHKINDSIFEKKPDLLDIFDDFCGFFSFDYNKISGLSYVLSNHNQKTKDVNKVDCNIDNILCFVLRLLEEIFIVALDYQFLIDSYFRYLYMPKNDWAKFCKISIFLMTVHSYITKNRENTLKLMIEGDGYYQDTNKLLGDNIYIIGTSNYNTLEKVLNKKVIHLNGSVDDYYDPYKNRIVDNDYIEKYKHIYVPFLFTQSGIKPYSSVSMSRRYVDIYDRFSECDTIGVVGFGFNADDGHINSLFRELIEEKGKRVVVFNYPSDQNVDYKEKLRLSNLGNLIIKDISEDRKVEGTSWTDILIRSADS